MNKTPRAKYERLVSKLANALKFQLKEEVEAFIKTHGRGAKMRLCEQLGLTNSGEIDRIFSEESNPSLRIYSLIAEKMGKTLVLVPIYDPPKISDSIPTNLKEAIECPHNAT